MNVIGSLFRIQNLGEAILILFALVLLAILIISFRSRPVVFCQYLHVMTGVSLSPAEVRRVFRAAGKNGVRETLLDLLIRQDFEEQGPVVIPDAAPVEAQETVAAPAVASQDTTE
ncbi:MAG TPA: hypothetical protein VFV54_01725 [Thermoanaerobaculia bacterium]|nr:hypothetical protein [Thermoanaerobaculia bacterium]